MPKNEYLKYIKKNLKYFLKNPFNTDWEHFLQNGNKMALLAGCHEMAPSTLKLDVQRAHRAEKYYSQKVGVDLSEKVKTELKTL